MSQKIRVTWQNPIFLQKTYNKGEKGLGILYTTDSKYPNEIVFDEDTLQAIRSNLQGTIRQWSAFSSRDISNYFGGARGGQSLSEDMIDGLKKELNKVLFQNTLPNRKTYFPFNDRLATSKNKSDVMAYMLNVLNDYVEIATRILNIETGLADYLNVDTTERIPRLVEVPESKTQVNIGVTLIITKLQIPLLQSLIDAVNDSVTTKAITFFDDSREYKTLLNFGNDRQYVAEAWRLAPFDTSSVQFKLITPLDTDINVETKAFVSRELAESVVDIINFELAPPVDNTPYLRPANMDVKNYVDSKMFATNATLTSLGLATGSAGTTINENTISYDDIAFRRWFTGDFKSSELNIDFTNYNNFVHFGSAYKRLEAFTQKLEKIEQLTSASISSSVSSSTISLMMRAKEKEDIIRTFDPYEQFLYYASSSIPYSASAFYVTEEVEYNATGSWPKQTDGTVYSPHSTIATNWLTVQSEIAQRYDYNNPNYLILNLPKHIQEDSESTDFLTLFDMIGHLMDNIKVYADQFSNIYSTNIDPLKELSMDQVYEVAQSFGLKLPNVYALESLQTFNAQFSGETGSRAYVAETWKRFLHSMVYLAKTKGSRTSFDALLNTYGINSPVLQIKETTHPASNNYIQSDELTYGLRFTGSVANNIRIPFVSSSLTASTVQISFNPTLRQSSSIVTANSWAIDIVPHPSGTITSNEYLDGTYFNFDNSKRLTYGRIQVVSGSGRAVIATSSYFPLFGNDYTNLMLRSQSGDISIIQTDGDQILFQESASVNLSSLWNSTQFLYIGGLASSSINAVASRSLWTAGALNTSPAFFSRSIDGNAGTRWDTNQFQSAGLIYSVNFNQQLTLVSFTMDTTGTPNDYPGTFSISSSLDGTTWTPIDVISGSTITSYSFASPTLASQLRLSIVNPRTGNYWSIHEFNVSASISISGSLKLGNNFDGIVDEIRVWGENISTDDFVAQAYDPGSYYGNSYTSSYSNLYVHVPFSQPLTSITSSVTNESPYQNVSIVATLPATGFTTASFTRVLRSIKQFTPIVGSTIYTNKKVVVVDPPVFNRSFVEDNGTRILSPVTSIKQIREKEYNSGQNVISFAVSPTDFINQNIIRSMGVVDVNNIIGSPRYITGSGYSTLQSIQEDYLRYFNKTVKPNDYIRFFKDLTQGPSEMADEMVPARGKLLDGIVIESSILSRNKDTIIRKFVADGSEMKKFIAYISGSGSSDIGAYDFDSPLEPISLVPESFGDTLPITAIIPISSSLDMKESTKSSKLPSFQQVLQQVGNSYVTSSLLDQNSSYATLESIINTEVSSSTISSGYARNPYLGTIVIPTEDNTLIPFYDIPPRSDFEDVGTFTYFHKSTGIYSYDIYTKYKTQYLVKLDTDVDSAIDRLFAPVTLLGSGSIANPPIRDTATIPLNTYAATSGSTGVIKIANIFSLYGINGTNGLRVRLYRNLEDLTADETRSFSTAPTINSGVLFDAVLDGNTDVFPYTLIQTIGSNIYYSVDNTTSNEISSAIDLQYFAYEPGNLLPVGYLPRHYKFNRENTTALKRRNYVGCKTTSTTFDESSPIIITLSSANTVVVNSTTTSATAGSGTVNIPTQVNTIKFGGGGTLGIE